MRKARTIVRVLLIASVLSGIAHAQDAKEEKASPSFAERFKERVYMSGTLEIEAAIQTGDGGPQKFEWQLQPEFEFALPHDLDITLIPRLRFDAEDRLVPGQQSQHEIASNSRTLLIGDRAELELRELYLEAVAGDTYLTIGKQQVVWGKADGLKVLDVVNPQDFREFVLDDFDNSRIPLWTFNAEISIKQSTLQLLWIPDRTYHKIPEPGAVYEFVSNVPQPTPGLTVIQNNFDRPNNFFKDSDFGARLSGFWKGWDVSLNYLYHYDDVPVLFRTLSAGSGGPVSTVSPTYKRTHLFGTSFSNAFGDLTFRAEIGYSIDKYYSTTSAADSDGVHRTGEIAYVLGFDWFGFSETLLSVQIFQNILTENAPGLLRDRVETNLSFLARRTFANATITLSNIWVHNLNDDDGFIRPKIEWDYRDNLTLWAGVDYFYGTEDGLFGQFDNTDRIVAGAQLGF